MLVPRAKPALRPRNKRFLRAEKGMPESFLKRERVRVCVKETSRERRVACASRPPLPVTKSDQGWPVSGVQSSACPGRGMFPVPLPRSLIENVARIPGRAGHLPRLLSPRGELGSADCTPSRREPRPGVRLGIWLPQPSAACLFLVVLSFFRMSKSMMRSRDRDPHRSKLDSCPAADVSMPAGRRQGAQRLLPPTRLDRTAVGLRLAQRRLRSHKVANRVVG